MGAPGLSGTAPEWLTEVIRLLPELRQRFPALSPPAGPPDSAESWRLFEGVAQLILALAAERPVLVSMDDLQWCDGDSCNLLRFLTRRTEQAPVLWLGTLSLGELERDAPSARLCRVLRAKSHARVSDTRSAERRRALANDSRDGPREHAHRSAPRFANRIFGVTAGNPFYVIELLKTMFAQGLLAVEEESGEWTALLDAVAETGGIPVLPDGARRDRRTGRSAPGTAERGADHGRRGGSRMSAPRFCLTSMAFPGCMPRRWAMHW